MNLEKIALSFARTIVLLMTPAIASNLAAQNSNTTYPTQEPNHEGKTMTQTPAPQIIQLPPDVVRYLKGANTESRQYDFLIGDWDVEATKYKEDGSVLFQYRAKWSAKYLNEGRMVMDDFKAYSPAGQEISSYVTLRTYSEVTHRWEMSGLAAFHPAANAQWYGEWKDGEMQLNAVGINPEGKTIRTKIRFFNIKPMSFNWESKSSHDDGKTWIQTAALEARRSLR
jgi:hypothetical protein